MSEKEDLCTRETDEFGTYWYNSKGQLHNPSWPAVVYKDGSVMWYKNGLLHNLKGPAVEMHDGYKEWWRDGMLIYFKKK
jgi:hypothetical protein